MSSSTIASDQELDATFAALADPTRRGILTRLASGDATVNQLAAPFDMTLPAVSRHLKVLITRTRHAQFRPCHLELDRLVTASDWIEQNKHIWSDRFDQLEVHLRGLARQSTDPESEETGD